VATILIFLGITAALASVLYFGVRWLFFEQWTQWRQGKREREKALAKEQRKQALRLEVMNSVLSQIGDPGEIEQIQTRRAA
jgi:threonine/homoserine/homoserine lactone efflux protein